MKSSAVKILATLLLTALTGACAGLSYYGQSIQGQMEIIARSRPIQTLIDDPDTEPSLREKLEQVQRIRDFAVRVLSLPDNESYRSYAELGRKYAVWNVYAAPELELKLREWCFPFVGCVSYRGYFSPEAAERFAAGLRAENDDVYVAGVAAYSTLGWFHDPVFDTILHRTETEMAGLIFHELAHQVVYVRGDTAFNESFAMLVEQEGSRRWLAAHGNPAAVASYNARRVRRSGFVSLILRYRARLQELYGSDAGDGAKRAEKARLFAGLQRDYQTLKAGWGGYTGYDDWFSRDLNNAHILSVGTYHRHVPALRALLKKHHNKLPAFYREVRRLGHLPLSERASALRALARSTDS